MWAIFSQKDVILAGFLDPVLPTIRNYGRKSVIDQVITDASVNP
jgi:hypothetical protein